MDLFFIPFVAFIASVLTFFSGFGLGTLLMPVFAIFFPLDLSIALTAIVHLLNNVFKLSLVGRHANKEVLIKFGIPAILSAFIGAWILAEMSDFGPAVTYKVFDKEYRVLWVNLIVAFLMIGFTVIDLIPKLRNTEFDKRYLSLGGVLSGFFGGLSGHQGALRSAFLARLGLSKESFLGTGVVIACLIDVARLSIYQSHLTVEVVTSNSILLSISTIAAFAGAFLGNRFFPKMTMAGLQKLVAVMLLVLAFAIGLGII